MKKQDLKPGDITMPMAARVMKHMKTLVLTGAAMGMGACADDNPIVCDPMPDAISCDLINSFAQLQEYISVEGSWQQRHENGPYDIQVRISIDNWDGENIRFNDADATITPAPESSSEDRSTWSTTVVFAPDVAETTYEIHLGFTCSPDSYPAVLTVVPDYDQIAADAPVTVTIEYDPQGS